jgi:hypothetical protein
MNFREKKMKTLIPVCVAILALSGCASLDEMTSAKKLEAIEIFRGNADEKDFPTWAECAVKDKNDKSQAEANFYYGKRSTPSKTDEPASRPTSSDSITRAFICAMRAEHDAYQDAINRIRAERQETIAKQKPDAGPSATTDPAVDSKKSEGPPAAIASKTTEKKVAADLDDEKNRHGVDTTQNNTSTSREHLLYWQRNFADDAIAVANMNCDYHFRDAEIDRSTTEFRQGALNTVASAVGAGLAALSSHNRAIFNLATTSTAANSIAAQYKSIVFLTPLLRKLHKKLDAPRNEVAASIRAALTLEEMPRVMLLKAKLVEYEQLCSRESLVELLSQAVDIPRYDPPTEISLQAQNEAKQLMGELAKVGKTTSAKLAEKTIKSLSTISAMTERIRAIALLKEGTNQKELGDIADNLFKDEFAEESSRKLNRIMVLLKYDDDTDLAAIKLALTGLLKETANKVVAEANSVEAKKTMADAKKGTNKKILIEATNLAAALEQTLMKSTQAAKVNSEAFAGLLQERKGDRRILSAKRLDDVRVRIFATQPR